MIAVLLLLCAILALGLCVLAALGETLKKLLATHADSYAWNQNFMTRQETAVHDAHALEQKKQQADAAWRQVERQHMAVCAKRYELLMHGAHDEGVVKH